jgi:HlyD family secretion protein
MNRIQSALASALIAAFGLSPAHAAGGVSETATAAPASRPAITVATVGAMLLTDRVIATGTIAPHERVLVQPQIEGQAIDSLLADVGDEVTAGQVIAQLSDTALGLQSSQLAASRAAAVAAIAQSEAQLVSARSNADEAERVRVRAEKLKAQGTASQAATDQAMAAATSAAAQVNVAAQGLAAAQAQLALVDAQIADIELKLARTRIKAPVAGRIAARNAEVGAIASAAGQPMFTIIRDGLLELRADVAEEDLLKLQAGQKVSLRVVGLPEMQAGTVRLVEPEVDAVSRLGRVRIALDDPAAVRSGLFAEAEIIVASREALAVPVTSVSLSGAEPTVLKVSAEGLVESAAVQTGIRDGGMIEIVAGLTAGDRIVLRAGAFVRPGDRIEPVAADSGLSN